jgi:spore coat polysaccharide biosynthesis protein SpsF
VSLKGDRDLNHYRWTLDHPVDYVMLSQIAERLKDKNQFGHLDEVLALLREDPGLLTLNQHLERDAAVKGL